MTLRERSMVSTQLVDLPAPWRSSRVAVVLPTYQEAANLPVIIAALFSLPLLAPSCNRRRRRFAGRNRADRGGSGRPIWPRTASK